LKNSPRTKTETQSNTLSARTGNTLHKRGASLWENLTTYQFLNQTTTNPNPNPNHIFTTKQSMSHVWLLNFLTSW